MIPNAFRHQHPPILDQEVLDYLPDASLLAVVIRSPLAIAGAIESTPIFHEYGQLYQDASKDLQLPGGANLWEVETWAGFGIDISAPAGAALWIEDEAVGVFFVTLSDAQLFLHSAQELALANGIPAPVLSPLGSGELLAFGSAAHAALVRRGTMGALVVSENESDLGKAVTRLAGLTSSESLRHSARVAHAFAGLDFGEDLAGFIAFDNIARLLTAELKESSLGERYVEDVTRLESSIEAAKSENRSAESRAEIDRLEAELETRLRGLNQYEMRKSAQARIAGELLAPLGTIAFAVDLDGKSTRARLSIRARPESLPARLLAAEPQPLRLPRELTEAPLVLLGAQVSSEASRQLLDLFLQLKGETRASSFAALKSELGVDLLPALALVQGEVSAALTLDRDSYERAQGDPEAIADALGMHILLGLSDTATARKLLLQAASSKALRTYARGSGDSLTLEFPGPGTRRLRLEIIDEYLQLRSIDATSAPTHVALATEQPLGGTPALLFLDPTFLDWYLLGSEPRSYPDYYGPMGAPGSESAQKRLSAINEESAALRTRLQLLLSESFLAGARGIGQLTISVQADGDGVAALATLTGQAANLGRALQVWFEIIEPALSSARLGARAEREEIEAAMQRLEEERWRILEGGGP